MSAAGQNSLLLAPQLHQHPPWELPQFAAFSETALTRSLDLQSLQPSPRPNGPSKSTFCALVDTQLDDVSSRAYRFVVAREPPKLPSETHSYLLTSTSTMHDNDPEVNSSYSLM